MYQDDMYYKELLFNSWFESNVKKYKEMRNGKVCDSEIKIKHYPFIEKFNKAYKKNIAHYDTRTDCFSDCLMLLWEGLVKFEIRDGSNWKDIVEGKDKKNMSRLVQYLGTYVAKEMNWLNSDYEETTKQTKLTIEDEEKRHITHVFYRVTPASIHHLILPKGASERVEIGETVEDSYWNDSRKTACGMFHEWLDKNAEKILKPRHIKLLKILKDANYCTFEKRKEEYEKVTVKNLKPRLKAIYDLLTKEYLKDKKFLYGGFLLNELNKEFDALKEYMSIYEKTYENVDDLAHDLTKHILNSMSSNVWEHIIYEKLPSEIERAIIKEFQRTTLIHEPNFKFYGKQALLSNTVLNAVKRAVETRIDELVDAMEKEVQYLESLGEREEKEVTLMHFELPKKGENKMVYMDVSPDGIMFQRHKR